MPASQDAYTKIKEYSDAAAAKNYEAAGMASAATTLPDEIMNAVREDRTSRGVSKLATDTGNVMGQMVTDPNAIRGTQEQGLMDPFSVNALTSGARAQNLKTLGTISTQSQENQGSLDQVIQAGANAMKARAQKMLAEAEKFTANAGALQDDWSRGQAEKTSGAAGNDMSWLKDLLMPQQQPQVDDGFIPDGSDGSMDFAKSTPAVPTFNPIQAAGALLPQWNAPKIGLNLPGLNISLADLIAKIKGKNAGK